MKKLNDEKEEIAIERAVGFFDGNADYFSYIPREKFIEHLLGALAGKNPPGEIAQILSVTGIEKMLEADYWEKYRREIETGFDLDGGKIIIEPGAGVFPILSSQLQKAHPSSTFVPIDPKIHVDWSIEQGLTPIKENFQYSFCYTQEPDIILETRTCGLDDDTVRYVEGHEQVELYFAMCDCNPLASKGISYDEYAGQILNRLRNSIGDRRSMDVEYGIMGRQRTPIVRVRKLKKHVPMSKIPF